MSREVGLLMPVDVSCEDVDLPNVQSGVIDFYGLLSDVTVDSQEVEPMG